MTAVMYMHARGYMHRDISTGNVFVVRASPALDVKLGDFGLATTIKTPSALPMMGARQQQTICGTPAFMAP